MISEPAPSQPPERNLLAVHVALLGLGGKCKAWAALGAVVQVLGRGVGVPSRLQEEPAPQNSRAAPFSPCQPRRNQRTLLPLRRLG